MKTVILILTSFLFFKATIAQKEYIDSIFNLYKTGNEKVLERRIKTFKRSPSYRKDYDTYTIWVVALSAPVNIQELKSDVWYRKLRPFIREPKRKKAVESTLYFLNKVNGDVIANFEGPWTSIYCNPKYASNDTIDHPIWTMEKKVLTVLRGGRFEYVFTFSSSTDWKYIALKNNQFYVISIKSGEIKVYKLDDFIIKFNDKINDYFPMDESELN